MARASITGAMVAWVTLYASHMTNSVSLFVIWLALRGYALTRCLLVSHRVLISEQSPFKLLPQAA